MLLAFALAIGAAVQAPAARAEPQPSPAWSIQALAVPGNFVPGDSKGRYLYEAFVTNVGGAPSSVMDPIVLVDTLPAATEAKEVELEAPQGGPDLGPSACQIESGGGSVHCSLQAAIAPGEGLRLGIRVASPAAAGPLLNQVEVQGGGAQAASASLENEAGATQAPAGFQGFDADLTEADGSRAASAGRPPYQLKVDFALETVRGPSGSGLPVVAAGGDPKDVEVFLPAGFVGDLTAADRCTASRFNDVEVLSTDSGQAYVNACPDGSAVGTISLRQLQGVGGVGRVAPLYNLTPPGGMPARLGFQILGLPVYLDTSVRRVDGEYSIVVSLPNLTQSQRVTAAQLTLWGTPASTLHDHLRGRCAEIGGSCPAGIEPTPLLRLPTSCADPLRTGIEFDTWGDASGAVHSAEQESPPPVGCDLLAFDPTLAAAPTSPVADSPTGLGLELSTPPGAFGEADLRSAVVDLPEGLVVNPSAVDGLAACTAAQVELDGDEAARCPEASKLGTAEVTTPLLPHPLSGALYAAEQGGNPFGSLLAAYLVVDDQPTGVVLKLAGELSADPGSGRLTARFGDLPEFPVDRLRVELFDGPRALLRTPSWCGLHLTAARLGPWGAPATPAASAVDAFSIDRSPLGGGCPESPADLPTLASFEAGTAIPEAGAEAPLLLRIARPDGAQPLTGFTTVLPRGVTAQLAGTAECSPAAIALERPSCPAASRVGGVEVGVGAGSHPIYLGGDAYLGGPWRGAPASLAIVVPATAGPFDLGTVVVRAGLDVERESGRVRVRSEGFPPVVSGVPIGLRDLRIAIDRPGFIRNPTRCSPAAVEGTVSSPVETRSVSSRFQVGGCRSLAFDPRLSLRLFGPPRRGVHPRVEAVLRNNPGGANLRRLAVVLPSSLLLDSRRIRAVCARSQQDGGGCPPGSTVGFARARTPLLDQPLEGPIQLRESSRRLPDLLVSLRGRFGVDLVGRLDSVHGRLRVSFQNLPDIPLEQVEMTLRGGGRGLFANTGRACGARRAQAALRGQNDEAETFQPLVRPACRGR